MNNNDKRFIRSITSKMPSLEIFRRMVEILKNSQKEVDRLVSLAKETPSIPA